MIVGASGNETLAGMLETVRWRIEGTRQLYLGTSGPTALRRAHVICEEHLAILGALEAGDSARAESLMRGHLRQIQTETVGGIRD